MKSQVSTYINENQLDAYEVQSIMDDTNISCLKDISTYINDG